MSLSDRKILELNDLCNALVDGKLSDAQRVRLSEMLAGSDGARRFYVRYAALSASLHEVASEMQTDGPVVASEHPRAMVPAAWFWSIGFATAVVVIGAVLWIVAFGFRPLNPDENGFQSANHDEVVARLTGAKDCAWIGKSAVLQPGEHLSRGQQLELEKGVAEITFDSGAQLQVEGPARLEMNSAWDARLYRGTLKATVPPEATGFRVSNPAVEVMHLGSKFGMVVDESGATEVFALEGNVEASLRDAPGRDEQRFVLGEKQARRFARSGVSGVRDPEQKFRRLARSVALDRPIRPLKYLHWTFDELNGSAAAARSIGFTPGSFNARFEAPSAADIAGAQIEGRWKSAVRFDGALVAEAQFPAMSQGAPRTVAFWVRLAPDTQLAGTGSMVAWALSGTNRPTAQITWNRNPSQGILGALRTEFDRTSVVGTTPLRDGQWHHVAVVFIPTKGLKGTVQVRQYIDGRLDGITAKHLNKRSSNSVISHSGSAGIGEGVVWIGRAGRNAPLTQKHFVGDLDELFIADRVLSPQEIRQLGRENTVTAPAMFAAER